MTYLEWIAAAFGIANLILLRRRSLWNFPFGIAAVAIFFHIFWQQKLYSDAGLQIFFAVVQLYGWWSWRKDGAESGVLSVRKLGKLQIVLWLLLSIITTAAWGYWMHLHTDATHPWWDGAVAMFSVTAQILMTRRYLENWHWWIFVNLISIPLYITKELYITSGLYVLYLGLALAGLIAWQKEVRQ